MTTLQQKRGWLDMVQHIRNNLNRAARQRGAGALACYPAHDCVAFIKDSRENLPLADQGVTLPVTYARNSPAKPPFRLCSRQHRGPDPRQSA
jgi:hypothetical protein